MYALVSSEKDGGKARLLATTRTMWAMRRKWNKIVSSNQVPYKCIGILTPNGLVNYHGEPIGFHGTLTIRMGLDDDPRYRPLILSTPPGG